MTEKTVETFLSEQEAETISSIIQGGKSDIYQKSSDVIAYVNLLGETLTTQIETLKADLKTKTDYYEDKCETLIRIGQAKDEEIETLKAERDAQHEALVSAQDYIDELKHEVELCQCDDPIHKYGRADWCHRCEKLTE